MPIQTCGTNGDFTRYGIQASGCITLDILGRANGIAGTASTGGRGRAATA